MKIQLVTPVGKTSQRGNRVTADRWAGLLAELGHRALVVEEYERAQDAELLIALHAKKSARSIAEFRAQCPTLPIVLCMTGTDLYADISVDLGAQRSLELATRIVVLQERGKNALPNHVRFKAITIHQSCSPPDDVEKLAPDRFVVAVLGHLREVKDPFRAAKAARLAKQSSRLLVVHLGAALDPTFAAEAKKEMSENPRYRWLGEVPRARAMSILAGSDALALTSILEGGANACSEAMAAGIPIISSRIEGSLGLLGEDHPAYFPVRDTGALAELFERLEHDPIFLEELRRRSIVGRQLIDPAREREAWAQLLSELSLR